MKKVEVYTYLIISLVFISITSPQLFSRGMFMDGLIYATVAKNLANGYFDMWHLNFSPTFIKHFYGHPPLQMWIQALLYKIFGDSIFVERIYSLSTFAITGFLICKFWQILVEKKHKNYCFVPLGLWIIIPLNSWAAANNILENTMQIFILSAVISIYKSLRNNFTLNSVLAALFLFLGMMTKGFVALFPLSLPLLFFLFSKNYPFKKFITQTLLISFVIFSITFFLFFIFPQSKEYFIEYFKEQILGSLHTKFHYHGRFYILLAFLNQILPGLILIGIFLFYMKVKKQKIKLNTTYQRQILILSGLILSGTLPFILSLKQREFYLLPTLPFISIMFALFFVENINMEKLNEKKTLQILRISTYILGFITILIIYFSVGTIGRDKIKIHDADIICQYVPPNEVIETNDIRLLRDYSFMGYLARYNRIGLYLNTKTEHKAKFFICPKDREFTDSAYYKLNLPLKRYILYKHK